MATILGVPRKPAAQNPMNKNLSQETLPVFAIKKVPPMIKQQMAVPNAPNKILKNLFPATVMGSKLSAKIMVGNNTKLPMANQRNIFFGIFFSTTLLTKNEGDE